MIGQRIQRKNSKTARRGYGGKFATVVSKNDWVVVVKWEEDPEPNPNTEYGPAGFWNLFDAIDETNEWEGNLELT